jgi:hypothetical protein
MNSNVEYTCNYCFKKYKRKTYYNQHINVCNEMYKTMKERESDIENMEEIPNISDIYKLVKHLVNEKEMMKKEIVKLKERLNRYESKKDIHIELKNIIKVNERDISNICLNEKLNIKEIHNYIYNDREIIDGEIFQYFKEDLKIEDLISYLLHKLFTIYEKKNESIQYYNDWIYIYIKEEDEWKKMDNDNIKRMMTNIQNLILWYFIEWKKRNIEKINDDKWYYENIYMNVQKEVMRYKYTYKEINRIISVILREKHKI